MKNRFLRAAAPSLLPFAALAMCAPNANAQTDTTPAAALVPASQKVRARTPEKEWATYPTRLLSDMQGFTPPATAPKLSPYGGWAGHTATKTGFFHTQKVGDRWWMVDPDGYLFLSVGLNSVSVSQTPVAKGHEKDAFQTHANWAQKTVELMQANGFNTAGCWSDTDALSAAKTRIPYTRIWNFMSEYGKKRGGTYQQAGHIGYPKDTISVFDKAFETFCDEWAKQLASTKNDPYLLGHFSDNELPFPVKALDNYLALEPNDEGKRAAEAWLADRGVKPDAITNTDRDAFRGFMADRYFAITTRAIRQNDPNHLCLGSRIHGQARRSEGLLKAAGKYLDVVAINDYGVWNPQRGVLKQWGEWTNKPLLITEWYAKGDDSGMGNQSGAGWEVATQKERGQFYQNYTLGMLAAQNCVGWHWFKYADNDVTNTSADPSNRDSNKGIVNIKLQPYAPLFSLMQELNRSAYSLTTYFDDRAGKNTKTAQATPR